MNGLVAVLAAMGIAGGIISVSIHKIEEGEALPLPKWN